MMKQTASDKIHTTENTKHLICVNASRNYNIEIEKGSLETIGKKVKELFPKSKVAIITDDIVNGFYSGIVEKSLTSENIDFCKFVFENGEGSKTLVTCEKIFDFLTENMITRSDIIIALGGGVVGDTAGFVAASYLRGIEFIQIPTTFLASIDSSVGGKTGVNTALGKNLVGAFWQPSLVIIDTNTFDTLPENIFADGVSEAIKYGVIKNNQLFEIIKSGKIKENLETVIKECILIKKQLVEQDERDTGDRMLLNFGHTIGHAIEKHSNHKISHGSGVAIGMVMMSNLSESLGLTNKGTAKEIENVCKTYNLPTDYNGKEKELIQIIKSDKKRKGENITIVLAKEIGTSFLYKISIDDFEKCFVK